MLVNTTPEELAEFYGVEEVILCDRTIVEQKAHEILNTALKVDTAFLVVGDPFCATTHTDLLLRAARDKGNNSLLSDEQNVIYTLVLALFQIFKEWRNFDTSRNFCCVSC